MAAPVLELIDVKKSYSIQNRELPILKGISFQVEQGEFVAIMGPSGSGKSTLLHLMGGLDRPTSGHIQIGGENIADLDDEGLATLRNQTIGFVFQSFFLLNYYTAFENVCLPLVYAGMLKTKKDMARQWLARVGLAARMFHKPNELSGGERQRVAIARALINNPQIIYADEPTGNLDTKTGDAIMMLLEEINQQGTTVVLITHDPHVAKRANRIVHIADGMILP